MKIPVIYRMFHGEILALFPSIPGTNDPKTCSSYQHIGQHGAADLRRCIADSRPATEDEYKSLHAEILQRYVELEIVSRVSAAHNQNRTHQIGMYR